MHVMPQGKKLLSISYQSISYQGVEEIHGEGPIGMDNVAVC